jgi:hypothetical protein
MAIRSTADRCGSGFGHSEVPYLAVCDEAGDRPGDLFGGHLGVDPVQVVQAPFDCRPDHAGRVLMGAGRTVALAKAHPAPFSLSQGQSNALMARLSSIAR